MLEHVHKPTFGDQLLAALQCKRVACVARTRNRNCKLEIGGDVEEEEIEGESPSFLAECIDHPGYASLLLSTARSPRIGLFSPDDGLFCRLTTDGQTTDRNELEKAAEQRRCKLARLRRLIVDAVGCERTTFVLLDVFDERILPCEIATILDVDLSKVTCEIQRLLRVLAQKRHLSKVSTLV